MTERADTMTRPTVLDMDLVVVPQAMTPEMIAAAWAAWHSRHGGKIGPGPAFGEAVPAAIFASPYPTAWDDVRKYVEGLEEKNEFLVSDRMDIGAAYDADVGLARTELSKALERVSELERFLFPYAHNKEISGISWDGKYLIGDKASISEFHSLKNRGEQIDVYKRAYDQNLAATTSRAEAAEARIAELEKRLADAEKIVKCMVDWENGMAPLSEDFRAARAYMEGK